MGGDKGGGFPSRHRAWVGWLVVQGALGQRSQHRQRKTRQPPPGKLVALDGSRDPRQAARAGTWKLADPASRPYPSLNITGARTLPGAPPQREQRFPAANSAPEAFKAGFEPILAMTSPDLSNWLIVIIDKCGLVKFFTI